MTNDFWRDNNFRLEPWGTDYEPPIELSEELSLSESEVDPTVETKDWNPVKPRQKPSLPQRIVFIDGRRRIDAALVGGERDTVYYGAFGTIAVGAVDVNRATGTATYSNLTLRRILGFGGNQPAQLTRIPCPLGSTDELVYEPIDPAENNTPQIRKSLIQNAMLNAEDRLAAVLLAKQPDALVIRDGQFRWYNKPDITMGYVKTMRKHYLLGDFASLLRTLNPGERTPIFAIQNKKPSRKRWSWYLRSGSPDICPKRLGYHELQGIVRLELYSEAVPLDKAKEIADQSTYLIPQYASHPSRDPRAPQNLTPVGALEQELGRRMGDRALIERRLRSFFASLGAPDGKAEGSR
ncbi:DNA double-strand break repair nuclease NurA [Lusitaniella coriacea]|uniref:DNA double-strand break repair nuclease NurA n=1 Tax=Lusitaniella coriacea TaxID=1983105 RepID=UPI003CF80F1E